MYRFRIEEDPAADLGLSVQWEGFGTGVSGYDTSVYVWNFEKGEWGLLSNRDALGTEEWLGGSLRGSSRNYFSGDGYLHVLVRSKCYVSPPPAPHQHLRLLSQPHWRYRRQRTKRLPQYLTLGPQLAKRSTYGINLHLENDR